MTADPHTPATDLHTRVVEDLGRQVVTGVLATGSVFRLRDLAADLGVSMSVAREAVRVLEGLNLLSSRKKVGVIVRPSGDWQLLDPRVLRWQVGTDGDAAMRDSLAQLLVGVAPEAAHRAVLRASTGELEHLAARALALAARSSADARRQAGASAATDRLESLASDLLLAVVRAAHDPVYDRLADMAELLGPLSLHAPASREDALATGMALHGGDGTAAHAAMARLAVAWKTDRVVGSPPLEPTPVGAAGPGPALAGSAAPEPTLARSQTTVQP